MQHSVVERTRVERTSAWSIDMHEESRSACCVRLRCVGRGFGPSQGTHSTNAIVQHSRRPDADDRIACDHSFAVWVDQRRSGASAGISVRSHSLQYIPSWPEGLLDIVSRASSIALYNEVQTFRVEVEESRRVFC